MSFSKGTGQWIAASLVLLAVAAQAESLPGIQTHDNRTVAGTLRDGVLTVRLEVGHGLWHPEAEDGTALAVNAFGETGKSLQNPGPLIRIPQGTEISASVHNSLATPLAVHGLCAHPCASDDGLNLAAGETRQVRFAASTAGMYYYWAAKPGATLLNRDQADTQLQGALVVDPPGGTGDDTIFIISVLEDRPAALTDHIIATINGRSWPYTKHVNAHVGELVRWRLINASEESHAMHLHGFYYRIGAMGDGDRQQTYSDGERPMVVTQRVDPGQTFDMTWSPERGGRWLFHCHMVAHMVAPNPPQKVIANPTVKLAAHPAEHTQMDNNTGMGQMVIGVIVPTPDGMPPAHWEAQHKLQLVIDENDTARPRYRVMVNDLDQNAPSKRPSLIGPPIVVERGQPTEIEVVNRTKGPTAIHWHGIELESYYDGVPGWTGTAGEVTPAIASGSRFVARMTPPRAGTFIYHTHWHDETQLTNGIYGPLLVLPPGKKFDPTSDLVFVFSLGDFEPLGTVLLINGTPQSAPLRLQVGKKYRLRLINIAPSNVAMESSLRANDGLVKWRRLAKDGADLPASAATLVSATTPITVGETYDFEVESAAPKELLLDVYLPGPKIHTTQTLVFAPQVP